MPIADPLAAGTAENRCVFHAISSANYRYSHQARHVQTYIRLIPPAEHGGQRLIGKRLRVAPLSHYDIPDTTDRWGNTVSEVRHDQLEEFLTIIADLKVSTVGLYSADGLLIPTPVTPRDAIYAERRLFGEFSDRTRPNADLERVARELCGHDRISPSLDEAALFPVDEDPFEFATRVAARVHSEMTFLAGSTNVGTTASEAWNNRSGVCQDFTHIALALFRLSGVPARYVSGFVPGEGVTHAWVEVLLPRPGEVRPDQSVAAWYAIDPTYNKWRTEQYISVAVGRDYGDVTPVSGTYFSGGVSRLTYGTKVDLVEKETVLV